MGPTDPSADGARSLSRQSSARLDSHPKCGESVADRSRSLSNSRASQCSNERRQCLTQSNAQPTSVKARIDIDRHGPEFAGLSSEFNNDSARRALHGQPEFSPDYMLAK